MGITPGRQRKIQGAKRPPYMRPGEREREDLEENDRDIIYGPGLDDATACFVYIYVDLRGMKIARVGERQRK